MKRILLVGELNQTVSTVNKHLSTRFQTQMCVDSLELIKGMMKVFDPDMVAICLVGIGELDIRILNYFENQNHKIPVLMIGTVEECNYYQKDFSGQQYTYVTRPTTLSELMKKCLQTLRMEGEGKGNPEENNAPKTERKKRVLVVDDSGILLRTMKSMLEKEYEVVVATDGMMALEKAKRRMPDLILLDYEMPKMDGRETLEELRKDEALKEIPVVFLTGVADKDNIAAVLKLEPEGYLLKPIEQKRVMETIERVLSETL